MPAEALAEARAMADELASSERMGVRAALDVHRAAAALALGEADEARASAERLVAAFDEGVAPDGVYRARAWWVASQAFAAAGRTEDAAQALQRGARWISQQALPSVPAAFIDSFMHRNPTNRALLAAAGR
jgi:tetratricopeptide (TPR) repeat protein